LPHRCPLRAAGRLRNDFFTGPTNYLVARQVTAIISYRSQMLPFELPDWNEGIKASASFSKTNMPNPSLQEPGDSQHGARRIPVASQVAKSYHQQVQQRHEGPGVLHANGIGGLPNARDAEFWLRRAAVHESENQPEEAERVLMEALTRDVQPVTSVARALHELHLRKEDGSAIKSKAMPAQAFWKGSLYDPNEII